MKAPPPTPVLVFDGDCGFCRFWVARWRYRTGDRVEYQPFQDAGIARRFPEIPPERCARAVQFIEPDGRVSEAAEAVFRLLATTGSPLPIRAYEHVPGVRAFTETLYRLIADHRSAAARVTTLLWGRVAQPSTYALACWWFLRLLGVVYLVAFWSLATQILGLVGHDGILPAGVGDTWLRGLCAGGAAVSSLLIAGVAPLVVLPLLWAAYLWLSTIAGPFLSFQWDALLLEAGFLAIFIAPIALRDRLRRAADPPRLAVWLMLWLLFRLMLGPGAVKLASGDPTWHGLTALTFHYETQPIPTPVAWRAHHLPAWFNRGSTAGVLVIELVAPMFILGPRRLRALAFGLLVGVQALIALTGNYAFFNLLSVALCLFLLDDAVLSFVAQSFPRMREASADRRSLGEGGQGGDRGPEGPTRHRVRHALLIVVAVVTVPVSALHFTASLGLELPGWPLVLPMARLIAPLRSVNSYGLFAVMTTTRPEIVIEGSDDGTTWLAYEFRYKAGDVRRRPPWVAPHQPRLDWQMWFAALDRFDNEPWFQSFCARLLEGSPEVLRLLARDPFQGRPPRYVRGVLYRYHFSDAEARRRDGVWWTRERLGEYSPVLSLRAGYNPPSRE